MAMKSSVTISLVPEVRGGPFVFWDDLAGSCRQAAELGFDAVEIFAPEAAAIDGSTLRRLLDIHKLQLAAMGTGAGWVRHKLTLTSPDPTVRENARHFIRAVIDTAGPFGGPAIIGSLQGRWDQATDKTKALDLLRQSLNDLGDYAKKRHGVPLLFEPLNRYETNLVTTIADGVELLQSLTTDNVRLLADLFHMNIEEQNLAASLRAGGKHIGHVHFVDSNRRPAGFGHMDYAPIAGALRDMGYDGYLSAEALAYPDPLAAARQTIQAFRTYFT